MDKFIIKGGKRLHGEVVISGAKNAAVAIIPAVAMAESPCRIENVPNISDVKLSARILTEMGATVRWLGKNTVEIDPTTIHTNVVPSELGRKMRGSYYNIGALLGRCSKAIVPLPGGCDFGVRPIDQHIKGFKALGCTYSLNDGMIEVSAKELRGAHIYLDMVPVGATMNIILAAVKAKGLTVIENAAREPHVVDLANFLNSMGANISGAGTDVIKIRGVEHLKGITYSIIPDQIEAGTYMAAAAATRGDVLVKNVTPKHLESITAKLMEMGVTVVEYDDAVRVRCDGPLSKCNVKTMPHPGFPTDMQPQIAALLSIAQGTSILNESVWENRFRYVEELKRMGAQITVEGKSAIIEGVEYLKGAPVRATDLRAGAAMIIAGLAAHGVTKIEDIEHIQRGYEDIVEKFVGLGAWHRDIEDVEKELNEIQALGLHGIKLHSDFQGFAIDDEKMLPVYKACMARDLPILFHMGDARSELSAPKKLANVLEKLPELKCIAAHLGGYQRWDEAKACLKGANVWVDTSSSLFVLNPDEARRSIEHFGMDKVMFGTDFPMWTHKKELERFFALGYGEEENRKMLYDNFEKLFKL